MNSCFRVHFRINRKGRSNYCGKATTVQGTATQSLRATSHWLYLSQHSTVGSPTTEPGIPSGQHFKSRTSTSPEKSRCQKPHQVGEAGSTKGRSAIAGEHRVENRSTDSKIVESLNFLISEGGEARSSSHSIF